MRLGQATESPQSRRLSDHIHVVLLTDHILHRADTGALSKTVVGFPCVRRPSSQMFDRLNGYVELEEAIESPDPEGVRPVLPHQSRRIAGNFQAIANKAEHLILFQLTA